MNFKKPKNVKRHLTLRVPWFLLLFECCAWIGGFGEIGIRQAKGQSVPDYLPDYTRYVIVLDNTFSMRRYHEDVEKALTHWLDDGWGSRASGGDGIAIWSYSKYGENALLKTTTWRIRAQQQLLDQSLIALDEIRYFGRPQSKEILRLLDLKVVSGTPLTVLWITDGKSDFSGSPFDSKIVEIFTSQQEFVKKAKTPFVLTLESKEGEWAAWGVNRLTLNAPPFLLHPSPAFKDATKLQSSPAENDELELPTDVKIENVSNAAEALKQPDNEDQEPKLIVTQDLEYSNQKTVDPEISKSTASLPNIKNEDKEDVKAQNGQNLKTVPAANPMDGPKTILENVELVASASDLESQMSKKTEKFPNTDQLTSRKEKGAELIQDDDTIELGLLDISSDSGNVQEKTQTHRASKKTSLVKSGKLSKNPADEARLNEKVVLNKKNPLRYFGLSLLFLGIAIGLAWTTRRILFPQSKFGSKPSSYSNNQHQNARQGQGSLISATQKTRPKNEETITLTSSRAKKSQ